MNRRQLWRDLSRFPWRNTAAVLGERFREDRLGLTASSLTFTTTIALVPFFTLALALFTVFPMFATMQGRVQRWLVDSLIPENISRQVLGYLTQFASKASGLGIAGLGVLLVTAVALILTIDKTLNNIWRVPRPRPLGQRILIYWAAITLGPLVLAASLSTTSWVFTASRGIFHDGSVLKLVSHAWAGFGAAFGPLILLALTWRRMTLAGALAGMVTGAAVVMLWIDRGWDTAVYELLPGFAAATLAILIVSLVTKPPQAETAAHG